MLSELLIKDIRYPYINGKYSRRSSIGEGIKAQVYVFAWKSKLFPVMNSTNGIDCLLIEKDNPVCAIEVNYGINKRSLAKLNALPHNVEKILISYGPYFAYVKAKYRNSEIGKVNVIRIHNGYSHPVKVARNTGEVDNNSLLPF